MSMTTMSSSSLTSSRSFTFSRICYLVLLLLSVSMLGMLFVLEEDRFVQMTRVLPNDNRKKSAIDKVDPDDKTSPFLPPLSSSSWSQTKDGQVCSSLFQASNGPLLVPPYGPSGAWNRMRHQILSASYFPKTHAAIPGYQDWVRAAFAFHSTERLRRSVAHPASTQTMRKLLGLIAEAVAAHNNNSHTMNTTTTGSSSKRSRRIHILVMGGSVTKGTNCQANSEVLGLPNITQLECSWPTRLEYLLNHVFFPERDQENKVFKVFNYAQGATNSEVGASLLENQLIPHIFQDKDRLPHVVISAYSTNDSRDPDLNATFYQHQQSYVRAAHGVRPCDDHLPLVLLADDLHGMPAETLLGLEQTGNLYKIASWYNVMAVNYANVGRHQAIASYVDYNVTTNKLFGGLWNDLHLGMGFHMGMAWTVLFNLLTAIQETCSDTDTDTDTDSSAENTNNIKAHDEYPVDVVQKPNSSTTNLTRKKWSFSEPPTKYQGSMNTMDKVAQEWRENVARKEEQCGKQLQTTTSTATASQVSPLTFSNNVCSYAWAVDRDTISEPKHIAGALEGVLKDSNGWEAKDYNTKTVFRSPGFGTEAPESSFTLELFNVTVDTHYLTVYSMKSWGPAFEGSKLVLDVQLSSSTGIEHNSIHTDTYEIGGHHSTETSVFFPHKFRLPGGGAKAGRGDSILVQAKLVSGRSFKITGMAFCQ